MVEGKKLLELDLQTNPNDNDGIYIYDSITKTSKRTTLSYIQSYINIQSGVPPVTPTQVSQRFESASNYDIIYTGANLNTVETLPTPITTTAIPYNFFKDVGSIVEIDLEWDVLLTVVNFNLFDKVSIKGNINGTAVAFSTYGNGQTKVLNSVKIKLINIDGSILKGFIENTDVTTFAASGGVRMEKKRVTFSPTSDLILTIDSFETAITNLTTDTAVVTIFSSTMKAFNPLKLT